MRAVAAVTVGWLGISAIADVLPSLLLPYHLLETEAEPAAVVGVATLVAIAVAAALQPAAGWWSDLHGRFPVMAAGALVAVAGLVLMADPTNAILGTVVGLAGVSVLQAGYQPLMRDRVLPGRRGTAAGAKGAFDVGGAFVGFAVVGALLAEDAIWAAVTVLAASVVASVAAARFLLGRSCDRPPELRESRRAPTRYGKSGGHALVVLVAARFLFLLGIYAVGRFLLLFVGDRFVLAASAAAEQAGVLLAGLALLTAVASLPAGWVADRVGRGPVALAGGLLAGIGIGLLPMAGSLEFVLAAGALMSLGTAAFGAGTWAALTDVVEVPRAGLLLGIANLGTAGAAATAGAFGVLIDAGNRASAGAGYGVAFGLAAVCAVLGGAMASRQTVRSHTDQQE